jgi:two-component system sensor histidine kinase NreB
MIARIVEAQEAERGRIARELHDEFGQHLASILLGRRLVEQAGVADEAKVVLAELVETINSAIAKLRALAIELRPTALDDLGLIPALERLTESYQRRTGIATTLDFDAPEVRLASHTETAIYRIVQESLTNAAKHANARSVAVRGESLADEVVVRIVDDGAGFDPAESEGGFGLVSMQERAALVSGTMHVRSAPANGTTIELRVPR